MNLRKLIDVENVNEMTKYYLHNKSPFFEGENNSSIIINLSKEFQAYRKSKYNSRFNTIVELQDSKSKKTIGEMSIAVLFPGDQVDTAKLTNSRKTYKNPSIDQYLLPLFTTTVENMDDEILVRPCYGTCKLTTIIKDGEIETKENNLGQERFNTELRRKLKQGTSQYIQPYTHNSKSIISFDEENDLLDVIQVIGIVNLNQNEDMRAYFSNPLNPEYRHFRNVFKLSSKRHKFFERVRTRHHFAYGF